MQKKILITFLFKEGAGPVFTLEMARGLAQTVVKSTHYFLLKFLTKRIGRMKKPLKVLPL